MKHSTRNVLGSAIAAALLLASTAHGSEKDASPFKTHVYPNTVMIEPVADAAFDASIELIVHGPDGFRESLNFPAGAIIEFDPQSFAGGELADGLYRYEARITGLATTRTRGESFLPAQSSLDEAHGGSFTILDGQFVSPDLAEESQLMVDDKTQPATSTLNDDSDGGERDQVILDDLIVDGSACIGFDCVNGESFGFDTLRLKENNLRIKFDDTSNSASFPSNDWQITANETSNGGANKFSIDDTTNGKTPFTVEANAPSHSMYIDDGGRIGMGTSTPVVEAHIVDGDTPTLRLEQDGSSGFTPQTWDVAGNETNFFVRDATNGSRLPFRIRPSAPSNSIFVQNNGNIGIGTASPAEPVHILRNDNSAELYIQDTGTGAQRMIRLVNNGSPIIHFEDAAQSNVIWEFAVAGNAGTGERFQISKSGSGQVEFQVFHDGDAEFAGDVTANGVMLTSARATKTDIQAVDADSILEKLASLDIPQWRYRHEPEGTTHIGAMAEDFQATFGLSDGKTLNMIDTTGISFAAIQALKHQVDTKQAQVDDLTAKVERLERIVETLAAEVEIN